jgi:hypothetical protein
MAKWRSRKLGPTRTPAFTPLVAELAGDEDLAAVQARPGDGLAHLGLVAVHLGGVDVPAPVSSAVLTAATVSFGSIWKTPKPNCGMV